MSEYSLLVEDVEMNIPWATKSLGLNLVVVNLWIENERATTLFHKYHYENLYVAIGCVWRESFSSLSSKQSAQDVYKGISATHYVKSCFCRFTIRGVPYDAVFGFHMLPLFIQV